MRIEDILQTIMKVPRDYLIDEDFKEAFKQCGVIFDTINEDVKKGRMVYPINPINKDDRSIVFKAFRELPPNDIRVVILGQDPYPSGSNEFGAATGLSFDIRRGETIQPSLKAIIAEMEEDLGGEFKGGEVSLFDHLPRQGVLLLNCALTVVKKVPNSHQKVWKPFTQKILKALAGKDDIVWILWGKEAQRVAEKFLENPDGSLVNTTHKLIKGTHPSPLAVGATPKFRGGKYFSKANEFLENRGFRKVNFLNS